MDFSHRHGRPARHGRGRLQTADGVGRGRPVRVGLGRRSRDEGQPRPTGSGKKTTLHSLLAEINTPSRKIWTAEDPIEITQPGLRQLQVNPKIGLTFASAMRAFLRADPDVIMLAIR